MLRDDRLEGSAGMGLVLAPPAPCRNDADADLVGEDIERPLGRKAFGDGSATCLSLTAARSAASFPLSRHSKSRWEL